MDDETDVWVDRRRFATMSCNRILLFPFLRDRYASMFIGHNLLLHAHCASEYLKTIMPEGRGVNCTAAIGSPKIFESFT